MATIDFVSIEQLTKDFGAIARLPTSVLDDILLAEADVVMPAVRRHAASELQGPYYAGGVAGGVTKNRPTPAPDGRRLYLNFNGTQHGNRLAEIAYINEFGKTGQPARPFMRHASESSASETENAGLKALDAFLKKHNF